MSAAFLAAWWIQGVVIAALLAGTAALLQWIARDAVPARAIWGTALVGATALTFVAPFRLDEPSPLLDRVLVEGRPIDATLAEAPAFDLGAALRRVSDGARAALEAPAHAAADLVGALPAAWGRGVLAAWAVVAALLLATLATSHRRLRRLLGAAESREIAGVPVKLTADLGPAVVGVRAPVVAVPRWLLQLPPAEQALVVRHEQSHVAAGDPLLLLAGVALAAVQPWNPFTWLILSRLRLAIELDCDRRLLRHGTSPRAYGDLLIALAAAASPALRPALVHPMFSIHRSHLAQRIIAMTERPARLITTRRFTVAALAAVALVAACESKLPTDADVATMDATMVEKRVAGVLAPTASDATWYVDGVKVTEGKAKELPASSIASVEVTKGATPEIRIVTGTPLQRDASAPAGAVEMRKVEGHEIEVPLVLRRDSSASVRILRGAGERDASVRASAQKEFTGLLIVDGVRVTTKKLEEIPPDRIESVMVVKGEAALKLYGPDAAAGVIVVRMKPQP